jgi:PleD family two-component response regulator
VVKRFGEQITALGNGTLRASAGLAPYTDDMRSPEALIDAADRALYESKGGRPRPADAPAPG